MKRLLILLFALLTITNFAQANEKVNLPSAKGVVTEIENIYNEQESIQQLVTVRILNGEFKGSSIQTENIITGNPVYDIPIKKGSKVVLHLEADDSPISTYTVDEVDFFISDIERSNSTIGFALLFTALLIIIGRKKGALSLVSIIVTVGLIFTVLVPMILSGFCPIAAAILVSIISTVIAVYLIGGFNAKSTSAVIGICLSLIVAAILSILAIVFANLTGFAGEENLFLYANRPDLSFKGILSASVILAALGAVMDVGVSIASTINEVHETDTSLTVKELFKSGMNVGKDIIGTMSNTLILVYLGNALPLVLLSSNIDLGKFFNLNQVATEILAAIAGSCALLICVPITAILAAMLIKRNKDNEVFFEH